MDQVEDIYKVKDGTVFHFENATVTVHIPDLTPEEREWRQEEFKRACVRLVRAQERAKQIKEQQQTPEKEKE